MTPSVRGAPFSVHWTVEREVVLLKEQERTKEVPRACVIRRGGSITELLKLTEATRGTIERKKERERERERERGGRERERERWRKSKRKIREEKGRGGMTIMKNK